MAKGLTPLIEDLSKAATECKELLVELRQERRMMKDVLREAHEVKGLMDKYIELCQKAAKRSADEEVGKEIKPLLEEVKEKVQQIADVKAGQISGVMNRIINLYMFGNEEGKGTDVFKEIDEARKRIL